MAERTTRKQFTFYESFYKAVSRIRSAKDRAMAYDALCAYALYGTEPDMETMSDAAAIAFELAKPNLDAGRRKASSGKKGGESKQTESKPQANDKQTASKKENKKENKKEKENECYIKNPDPPREAKHKHGEYQNVLLTDEDLAKLKAEFPDWEERIERLSSYIAQSGKSYRNHLATIRNWARKDKESETSGADQRSAENPADNVGTWL